MTSMNRSAMAVACTLFVALVLCVGSALGHGQDHRSPVHFINVEATTLGFEPAIQMQVSAKTVTNGEFVTVSWSGVSAPSDGDWVGVYSPSTTDMLTHVPIKFQVLHAVPPFMSTLFVADLLPSPPPSPSLPTSHLHTPPLARAACASSS